MAVVHFPTPDQSIFETKLVAYGRTSAPIMAAYWDVSTNVIAVLVAVDHWITDMFEVPVGTHTLYLQIEGVATPEQHTFTVSLPPTTTPGPKLHGPTIRVPPINARIKASHVACLGTTDSLLQTATISLAGGKEIPGTIVTAGATKFVVRWKNLKEPEPCTEVAAQIKIKTEDGATESRDFFIVPS